MDTSVQISQREEIRPVSRIIDAELTHTIYDGCIDYRKWTHALNLILEELNFDAGVIGFGHTGIAENCRIVSSRDADPAFSREVLHAASALPKAVGVIQSASIKTAMGNATALVLRLEMTNPIASMCLCLVSLTHARSVGSTETDWLQYYLPAFQKAFRIQSTLACQNYALEDYRQTARQLSIAILTVTDDMRVVHESGAVDAIRAPDGDFGIDRQNRLYHRDKSHNAALTNHVEQASRVFPNTLDGSKHVLMIPSAKKSGWWSILCKRMHHDSSNDTQFGLCSKVYIRFIPALLEITPDLMCKAMELTPRQAEVAVGIVNGMDIAAIACALGISRNTVRVHIAAIFAQTTVNSRSEFTYVAMRRLNNGWC